MNKLIIGLVGAGAVIVALGAGLGTVHWTDNTAFSMDKFKTNMKLSPNTMISSIYDSAVDVDATFGVSYAVRSGVSNLNDSQNETWVAYYSDIQDSVFRSASTDKQNNFIKLTVYNADKTKSCDILGSDMAKAVNDVRNRSDENQVPIISTLIIPTIEGYADAKLSDKNFKPKYYDIRVDYNALATPPKQKWSPGELSPDITDLLQTKGVYSVGHPLEVKGLSFV